MVKGNVKCKEQHLSIQKNGYFLKFKWPSCIYAESSALLCGLQPRPGMNYSGDLLTEMGFKHVADSFLKTFIEDVRNFLLFFSFRYKSKYFGCCGLE